MHSHKQNQISDGFCSLRNILKYKILSVDVAEISYNQKKKALYLLTFFILSWKIKIFKNHLLRSIYTRSMTNFKIKHKSI